MLRVFDDAMARMTPETDEIAEISYPNHLRDVAPIFEIHPKKELEIMAHKYRLQADKANEKFSRTLSARISTSGPIKLSASTSRLMNSSA